MFSRTTGTTKIKASQTGVLCSKNYKDGQTWLGKSRSQTSGRDLGKLIGETTGSAKRDLAKSRENTDSEVMIPIPLNHIPGIQKWRQ